MKTKVIIVDDHEIVRMGLTNLLIGTSVDVLNDVSSGAGLFQVLKKESPDVILLDLDLDGMSGFDIMKVVQTNYSDVNIIVLSANDSEEYILQSVKLGAKGFLSKDCSQKELVEGISSVAAGNTYFGDNVKQKVLDQFVSRTQNPEQAELTDRELEVLKGLADGNKYEEIANMLNVSKRTVEAHRKNVFDKLHFKNNADLIKYAIKNKIIKL